MNVKMPADWLSKTASAGVVGLCLAMSPANATGVGVCPDTLRYADTGVEGLEELRRAFGPFVEVMEGALGVDVEFFPVGNRAAAVNALEFEQIDVVMTGPSEYVSLQSRIEGVKPIVSIARPDYASIIIVAEDAGYESLADLSGTRIAMKDVGSTTGHIIPAYMLHTAGLDIDRDVQILNIDGTRFQALISGDVQAVGTGVRDWAEFEEMAGEGYKILAQSEQMPDDVILAGPHISSDCVAFMKERMMASEEELIRATLAPEGRDRYLGARLVNVDDSTYDVVREAYATLGLSTD